MESRVQAKKKVSSTAAKLIIAGSLALSCFAAPGVALANNHTDTDYYSGFLGGYGDTGYTSARQKKDYSSSYIADKGTYGKLSVQVMAASGSSSINVGSEVYYIGYGFGSSYLSNYVKEKGYGWAKLKFVNVKIMTPTTSSSASYSNGVWSPDSV